VNAVGTLVLFQATYPLLKASTPAPKFVTIGSRSGSISQGADLPLPVMPYGISKAAQLYITRKLRHEHEGLGEYIRASAMRSTRVC
jgi:NAD(P)-dependent dehydrogenase (short-subunit alcohol dehydrogenase family)